MLTLKEKLTLIITNGFDTFNVNMNINIFVGIRETGTCVLVLKLYFVLL